MKNTLSLVGALLILCSLTSCFRTRADIAREREEKENAEAMQQNVVQYQQTMEKMQEEMGRLQGKIEELEFQRKKEMNSQGAVVEGNAKTAAELKAKTEELQKSQAVLFDEIKRLREENVQLLSSLNKAGKPAPKGVKGSAGKGISFEVAMAAFQSKNYSEASNAFRSYLEANPKSKKSIDAKFYLGESLYHQKEYVDAIVEFGTVHEKAPSTSLGRKSTLRIAESFKALGKDKDAKSFAQILVQTQPNSAEAKQARKFLK